MPRTHTSRYPCMHSYLSRSLGVLKPLEILATHSIIRLQLTLQLTVWYGYRVGAWANCCPIDTCTRSWHILQHALQLRHNASICCLAGIWPMHMLPHCNALHHIATHTVTATHCSNVLPDRHLNHVITLHHTMQLQHTAIATHCNNCCLVYTCARSSHCNTRCNCSTLQVQRIATSCCLMHTCTSSSRLCACVCVCDYAYICLRVYICIYMCIYMYICIHAYTYIYICIYVYLYTHAHTHTDCRICVICVDCVEVCIPVCILVYAGYIFQCRADSL